MVNGSKHVRDKLRKTGDDGGLVLMEFFVVNPYVSQPLPKKQLFFIIGNGEKLSLIFRKNNSSLLKNNPIDRIL